MTARLLKTTFCAILLLAVTVPAQDDFDDFGPKPTGAPKARTQYEANLKEHKGTPDMLVLPGLVSDRKARTVEVLAEATGLDSEEVAEFLLIDQGSSHGYEALLWSFAKPSDVHRALEFIGLKPGTPVDPRALRFWADGDRVMLNVRVNGGETFPIERLILDKETDKTLPEEGFIFAGSVMVPSRDGKGAAQYAADVYDPRSVASIYNEPAAVLDVPRQATQGEVYGNQVVNPDHALDGGELLTIVMTPGESDGRPRARQVRLALDCGVGTTGMVCRLSETGGAVVAEAPELTPVLEKLVALKEEGAPPYVELSFGEAVPVTGVGKVCTLMAMMEAMGMVRIKPPVDAQPYYRAFVPDKRWLKPEGRPTQPWELHLGRKDDKAELVWHEPKWSDDSLAPTFTRRSFVIPSPVALCAKLDKDREEALDGGASPTFGVLLVYAPSTMRYGEVMAFVRPVLGTHGTVYVFVGGDEQRPASPSHEVTGSSQEK